jgi:hypothetical protein
LCTRAVGGLAHYLEVAGIPTTQISLVRLHTEQIRPPRALWVSFELGRPFGPPHDAPFQTRVIRAALALFERERGPLLIDYPEDAPATAATESWACPVSFTVLPHALAGDAALAAALHAEFDRFWPWYERALESHGRTTVGVSTLDAVAVRDFFRTLLMAESAPPQIDGFTPADSIRLAAEDLKAFYFEAAAAQPGAPDSRQLTDWFWHRTQAGAALRALRARYEASADADLALLGQLLLVPRAALDSAPRGGPPT